MRRLSLLFFLPMLLPCAVRVAAQGSSPILQQGIPIERTLSAGESHIYTISLLKDQFVQLVVDQRGIDVVVRVFTPKGRRLGEFDSPNGDEGPENVSVIADTAGSYRIEVSPLGQEQTPAPGRYEIKIVELRHATDQELQAAKNQEVFKQKAIALLVETTATFPELHNAQTRARFQTKAAQLLWNSDEKTARKLIEQAMDSVKEFIAGIDPEQDYFGNFQIAMQLRTELINVLAPRDPEVALNFLRSTRTLATPDEMEENGQGNQELELELALVRQVSANDPKRAFDMAEDILKRGYANSLVDTVNTLHAKQPDLAAKLAHDLAARLMNEKLLKRPEAAYLAMNFIRSLRSLRGVQSNGGGEATTTSLISEDEYRDLVQSLMSQALNYSLVAPNFYSPERIAAQTIVNMLKEMGPELEAIAPGSAAAVEKKFAELNSQNDPRQAAWQQYQNTVNTGTVETALQTVSQAPREIRSQLYQQIANRAAGSGDLARAKQIINDQIANPRERRWALRNLDQQAIFNAVGKGRIDEALRMLGNVRPAADRIRILTQIVTQIGPGQKRATVLQCLEQARTMLGDSPTAADQEAMNALLEIGRAFSRYDPDRAFQVVEPLITQFNDITESAVTMNGFGQRYYDKGDLIMSNGNAVAETSNQLARVMAALAMVNFERARQGADRINFVAPRINVYLMIAEQAINNASRDGNYEEW